MSTARQRQIEEATHAALRRRDELYFTRTNMLKEQVKLQQQLQGTLPPKAEGGARLEMQNAKPVSPRRESGGALAAAVARAPRSLDHVMDFENQLIAEWRAAESAATRYSPPRSPGGRFASPPRSPGGSPGRRSPGGGRRTPSPARSPARRVSFEFPADEQRRRAQALVGPASAMWATMVAGD